MGQYIIRIPGFVVTKFGIQRMLLNYGYNSIRSTQLSLMRNVTYIKFRFTNG